VPIASVFLVGVAYLSFLFGVPVNSVFLEGVGNLSFLLEDRLPGVPTVL